MDTKVCCDCGQDVPLKQPSGRSSFVQDQCVVCYRKERHQIRKARSVKATQDRFNRTPMEQEYYQDIGYDCQRNQDILLRGLSA